MPTPRKRLVNLEATPYYHCISRCVRRAWLCGEDKLTGKNFDHRRGWIEDKILQLAEVFCIDICAYAVMSNHFHIVLKVNVELAEDLSPRELLIRWSKVFTNKPYYVENYLNGLPLNEGEINLIDNKLKAIKERIVDISWFMRVLNEYVARLANAEDNVKGRFWEGRFKSQALLDETAVLACMAYVDLNPVRAGIAKTPEDSEYTSIKQRIKQFKNHDIGLNLTTITNQEFIFNMNIDDYLKLVDWTGKNINHPDKASIPEYIKPILVRIQTNENKWLKTSNKFTKQFANVAGSLEKLKLFSENIEQKWVCGKNGINELYS